jgi:hypothetical protein
MRAHDAVVIGAIIIVEILEGVGRIIRVSRTKAASLQLRLYASCAMTSMKNSYSTWLPHAVIFRAKARPSAMPCD